jgi:hypothetical protein
MLRLNCTIRLLPLNPRSTQHGVDERAGGQQIGNGEEQEPSLARDAGSWPCRFGFSHHLGPVCRDQEATAVRHDDDQMWSTIAASSAENLKEAILEGMMSADDPNQLRNIIDSGSVRRFPSTG